MRITISGPPGSGTTSLAKYLVEKRGYELISAGEVFRSLAKEKGMDLSTFGRLAESADLTAEREASEATRYSNYYGIDINDLSVYDLVVSSERWGRDELGRIVDTAVSLMHQ
jgi:cytidylate kinase